MNNYISFKQYNGRPIPETHITLDSNMVGYLYALSCKNLSTMEMLKIQKTLTQEQFRIITDIIKNDFKGYFFHTTPQVYREVAACAKLQGDKEIIDFLCRICKIRLPKDIKIKQRYAEIIADLMDEYLAKDIYLSNGVREPQSAIRSEMKNGVENFADAKITAENTILNGTPLVTRNEKHLISMQNFGRRNNLRSEAIIDKNRKLLKTHRFVRCGEIRRNLRSKKSTTFRINEIPYLHEL